MNLTHVSQCSISILPEKSQKIFSFLTFSGCIEREHWAKPALITFWRKNNVDQHNIFVTVVIPFKNTVKTATRHQMIRKLLLYNYFDAGYNEFI